MKNLTYALVALVLGIIIVTGCSKKNDAVDTGKLNSKNSLNTTTDTVVTPPTADTALNVPLAGDKITLSPVAYNNGATDSIRIAFNAVTTNLYCSNGLLKLHNTIDASQNFHIDFLHVQAPIVCHGTGDIPMVAAVNFQKSHLANGSYPLVITLNGTTYTGSIQVSATAITFDWNYTTGIVISPKTISR
ncbi:hypothetical protein AAFN85_23380 [Mucilaginibacter sp. CAU 1740]|uniref:hypothetical protein n=1 Tax=Mucilaginibacter sp. CAU 1740 TaxID=3140365 RepID=UPI00325A9E6E